MFRLLLAALRLLGMVRLSSPTQDRSCPSGYCEHGYEHHELDQDGASSCTVLGCPC